MCTRGSTVGALQCSCVEALEGRSHKCTHRTQACIWLLAAAVVLQALGRFSHLNAFLTPSDICAAMQRVLGMPLEQRQQLGRQARQQYLQDKAQFVKKLRVLRRMLHRRRMEGAYVQPGQTVTVEE